MLVKELLLTESTASTLEVLFKVMKMVADAAEAKKLNKLIYASFTEVEFSGDFSSGSRFAKDATPPPIKELKALLKDVGTIKTKKEPLHDGEYMLSYIIKLTSTKLSVEDTVAVQKFGRTAKDDEEDQRKLEKAWAEQRARDEEYYAKNPDAPRRK